MAEELSDYLKNWTDHPENPLIEPPGHEFLLGDPSFVLPEESPDGKWHLFANSLFGIHHFTSGDGIHWKREGKIGPGFRPYIFKEDDTFYLFVEHFTVPQFRSRMTVRTSSDLWSWSKMTVVLRPELPWEGRIVKTVGNPCLIKVDGRYRLYYSAWVVFFPDLGFCEPRHISAAHSDSITGPYDKLPQPIISPSNDDPYCNRAAGAIKVIFDEKRGLYYGFHNGIYRDSTGLSRSAILLLSSEDGLAWKRVYPEPIIAPEGEGWKKAFVYQLDVKRVGDEMWLYYNARDGWRIGKERIGLATTPCDNA
jgi:predicted GH43/DUF377 family glycosyl hydrolase